MYMFFSSSFIVDVSFDFVQTKLPFLSGGSRSPCVMHHLCRYFIFFTLILRFKNLNRLLF